jgi:ketosteroid isomerase-like protein
MDTPQPTETHLLVDQVINYFEHLRRDDLPQLGHIYAEHAHFKDPFNDVVGITSINKIFEHMFETLQAPRFIVSQTIIDAQHCFLVWDFEFRFKHDKPDARHIIHGGSHLVFDQHGKIVQHRDYWDAAQELYEKFPVIGSLMRWLKRRLQP